MVPEGWKNVPLSDVCELVNGRGFKPHEWGTVGYPIIRIQNLNGSEEFNYFQGEFHPKILVRDGELLFAWSGSRGTSFGPHIWRGPDAVLNYHTWRVVPKETTSREFLLQYLRHVTAEIETTAHGASALVHTQKDTMERRRCILPPLPEQQKIAEILGTWDKAIETTEALLANARTQKRALMQSLLTGTRRFPGFEDHPWREVRLDRLVDVNPSLNVCPIDGNLTFLPMEAVSEEAEIVAPRAGSYFTDLKGFTAFKDGDVLVAKITPCFENGKGCHARNLVNGVGTGSTEFHVLRPKIDTDVRFVFHLVNSHPFRERGRLNMQGSAGQQRVPSDYIRLFRWTIPSSPEERAAIGAAIDGATVEVEHWKRQLDHLRTEKKSLMQQLLTGKRRVVV